MPRHSLRGGLEHTTQGIIFPHPIGIPGLSENLPSLSTETNDLAAGGWERPRMKKFSVQKIGFSARP